MAMTSLEKDYEAYRKNKLNRKSWQCLTKELLAAGHREEAILYASLLQKYGTGMKIPGDITERDFLASEAGWDYFRLALMNISHTPLNINVYDEKGENIGFHYQSGMGDFLPGEFHSQRKYKYYCGVFNQGDFINETAKRMEIIDNCKEYSFYRYDNLPFDVMRVQRGREYKKDFGRQTVILPLGATNRTQVFSLSDGVTQQKLVLGQYEFRMVRVKGRIEITSGYDFLWGEPILMEHSSERHKLVLNILLDSLSYPVIKLRDFQDMPNLKRFFSKGLIFEEAYSPAEYTFPVLNAMATGKYMHHSGIIDESIYAPYEKPDRTISAQMKAQGYYCVNVMGDGRGLMTGAMRGYDRLILNPYLQNLTNIGVRRTIDHLEAFSECDNYVFLHVSDPHPFCNNVPTAMPTQTKVLWQDMTFKEVPGKAALWLNSSDFLKRDNLYMIRRMDEELGILFRYIEDHYAENEYVINVFSDHGVSIYEDEEYFFKDTQCHVAMMCRGAGIPGGVRSQELVNVLDLYAVMAKECGFEPLVADTDANLPRALGGQEREIVYSNSIFPGQTYKLCMRTKDYECRLETKKEVSPDGRVDIDDFSMVVYQRNEKHSLVEDSRIKNYFIDKAAEFLVGLVEL